MTNGLAIFLIDISGLMRIDILIWVAGVPAILVLLFALFYQVRQYRQLKAELAQLAKIKRHNIEYDLVLKAMKLSTWRLNVPESTVAYESDYRSGKYSFSPQAGIPVEGTFALIHADDRERVREALTGLMKGKYEDYHQQYRAQATPSSPFYWAETFATVEKRDIDGKPLTIVGTSMRIDAQKEIEQALIEARNQAEESDRLKSPILRPSQHSLRFSLPILRPSRHNLKLSLLILRQNLHSLRFSLLILRLSRHSLKLSLLLLRQNLHSL